MMSHDHDHRQSIADAARAATPSLEAEHDPNVSRRASVAQLRAIQMKLGGNATEAVHDAAARGVSSPETSLPHAEKIQASFGAAHDVAAIRAHVGGDSAKSMGATAFAAGSHVVFDRAPDLHTAAHEAAHVVQQAKGVNLYGGVGEAGDHYERHADAVADRVVAGQSAADLLGSGPSGGSASTAVQRKDITDGTKQEHEAAHGNADLYSATAFASKIDLLAVRIKSATAAIDNARMAPHNTDAGTGPAVEVINSQYDHIISDAEDLYGAASREKSLSSIQHQMMHTDLAILAGTYGAFKDACDRAMNWGKQDGVATDASRVYYWLNGTLGLFDLGMSTVTPIYRSDRIADKSVEDLENQTIADTIGAIHVCVAAVRKNVKSSSVDELGGDLYKLVEALHEVKELVTTTAISGRIRGTTGLKTALAEIHTLDAELQTANPGLAKRLSDPMVTNDMRILHDFVRTHKPAKG